MNKVGDVGKYWLTHGSWVVPIIIFSPKASANDVLIEGHTRLGILKGLLNLKIEKYRIAPFHEVILITEK